MVNNNLIILQLEKLKKKITFDKDYSENAKERLVHEFRWQAIERVIELIKKFPEKIVSIEQLKGIQGIGKGSLKRIDEILKTGTLSETENFSEEYQKSVEELQAIHGVGRRRAFEWVTKYGVKSIDDLKQLYLSGKIDLPDSLIKTLRFHVHSQGSIPRSEIIDIEQYLCDTLLSLNPELFGRVCGSYRREMPYSNDIDFLMVYPGYENIRQLKLAFIFKNYLEIFVEKLVENRFIVYSLTDVNIDTFYMGYCKFENNPIRRIDIRLMPLDSYYTALLYFTGPKQFNISMRKYAKKMGYHLSDRELTNIDGITFSINSEKNIFDILGIQYVEPRFRNNNDHLILAG